MLFIALNEDGNYQRLNSANFSEYYMSWNTEENARTHKIKFDNYRLEKDLFADSDDVFYALSAQSIDGTISLSYILIPNDSGDLIIFRACKCETNTCATTWGCEADTGEVVGGVDALIVTEIVKKQVKSKKIISYSYRHQFRCFNYQIFKFHHILLSD